MKELKGIITCELLQNSSKLFTKISMNIGFFTDCYTPQIDGVVQSVLLYKKALEKRGNQVFVFAPKKPKNVVEFVRKIKLEEEKNVFRFRALDSIFVPGYPVAFPISLHASYKIPKLNLDIIHSHSPITIGMFGNLVALMENIPIVFTYHTYYSEYAKYYWPVKKFKSTTSKIVEKFEVFYCNRVDHVITPSEKLKKILEQNDVENEISVIPTGIDLKEFEHGDKRRFKDKWKIDHDKKILLYVGRLGTEKNVEFLIQVLAYLKNYREIILVIVGDGKNRKNFERMVATLNLKDRVLFCGFLSREETLDAFFACDIFVFASKTDTQGLVLGEAAVCGKPIIMLRDKGLTEVVISGKNGFEVEEKIPIFSKKVLELLHNPDLYAKMSENSKKIAKNFDINSQAQKLENLYKRILKDYEVTSWRRKMWRELNKEYKIKNLIKKLING